MVNAKEYVKDFVKAHEKVLLHWKMVDTKDILEAARNYIMEQDVELALEELAQEKEE